jgi:hypothetical protein
MGLSGCVAIVVRIRDDPAGVDLLANDVHSHTHTGFMGLERGCIEGEVTEARTVRRGVRCHPLARDNRPSECVFDRRIRRQPPSHTGPSCGSTFLHRHRRTPLRGEDCYLRVAPKPRQPRMTRPGPARTTCPAPTRTTLTDRPVRRNGSSCTTVLKFL